jgi:hypothetical protein
MFAVLIFELFTKNELNVLKLSFNKAVKLGEYTHEALITFLATSINDVIKDGYNLSQIPI